MKHILPILTITTLAAAASAQTAAAAPSGLSYNRATVSYDNSADLGNTWNLGVEALVGNSNVAIAASTTLDSDHDTSVSVGYVFKNSVVDVTVSAGLVPALTGSTEAYSLTFRKALGNFEVNAGFSNVIGDQNTWSVGVAYTIATHTTLALSYKDSAAGNGVVAGVSYNF